MGEQLQLRRCVIPPIGKYNGIKHLPVLLPASRAREPWYFSCRECSLPRSRHNGWDARHPKLARLRYSLISAKSRCKRATMSIKMFSGDHGMFRRSEPTSLSLASVKIWGATRISPSEANVSQEPGGPRVHLHLSSVVLLPPPPAYLGEAVATVVCAPRSSVSIPSIPPVASASRPLVHPVPFRPSPKQRLCMKPVFPLSNNSTVKHYSLILSAQHPPNFHLRLRETPYTTPSDLPPTISENTASQLPRKGGYPQLQGRGYHSSPQSSTDISMSHLDISRGHRNVPHTSHCLSKATPDSSGLFWTPQTSLPDSTPVQWILPARPTLSLQTIQLFTAHLSSLQNSVHPNVSDTNNKHLNSDKPPEYTYIYRRVQD